MKETLEIAAVPLDIAYADVNANLAAVEAYLENMRGLEMKPDIVVLPELFTTSFISDAELLAGICEKDSGCTLRSIEGWAARYGCCMAGSFAAESDGKFFNRCFFVEPSGRSYFYDKRHLFSLSAEASVFSAGNKQSEIIDYHGWKLSMIVCYDLRFPVWCRSRKHEYDIMLVPANWPLVRSFAWKTLLSARAIENQAVYVGCDRSGSDDFGKYDNMSEIVDALGVPVGKAQDVGLGAPVIYAQITRSHLEQCRRRLPAGRDMDDFSLKY